MEYSFPLFLLALIAFFIVKGIFDRRDTPEMICMDCGTIGEGDSLMKGNGFIELILWLCFIIPGLIYSIWRSSSRHKACSACQGKLIQLDSPRGQQLVKQFEVE